MKEEEDFILKNASTRIYNLLGFDDRPGTLATETIN